MNVSPESTVIPIVTKPPRSDIERTAAWCTVGIFAILMACLIVHFAPDVWAFLKIMVALA